jgi:hypothetical protein
MPISPHAEEFLSQTSTLHFPDNLRILFEHIPLDSSEMFDLTFHASFASKMFALLKREGQNVQGFERMQQSLVDSVQKAISILKDAEREYNIDLGANNSGNVVGLIEDLTALKEWILREKEQ